MAPPAEEPEPRAPAGDAGGRRFERLGRAMRVWMEHRAVAMPAEDLRARNPDLGELLEPLLDGEAAQPAPAIPPLPRVLGDFRLEAELGRGGMGVVYAATWLTGERPVALKLLARSAQLHPTALERFQREAATLGKLKHPAIVAVLATGRSDEVPWIAMERVEGASLDRVIARFGGRPELARSGAAIRAAVCELAGAGPAEAGASRGFMETMVEIVACIAEALEYAHGQGIVHRDVKPSNIMLRRDGTPVLTDFGLARAEDLPSVTATGDFAGTPYYVSPEQAMAKRVPVDHRTDVFSLGATLYEALTCKRAFDGGDSQTVLSRILTKEPLDPRRLEPQLHEDLVAIVFRALEKDPDQRYPTAAALASDLRAFLHYRPVAARRLPALRRALRWTRRRPLQATLLGLGAGCVLLLAVSLAFLPEVLHSRTRARAERLEQELAAGFMELGEGRPETAQAAFDRALDLAPDSVEAVFGECECRLWPGHAAEALAFLDAHPQAPRAHTACERLRAHLLERLHRVPEAEAVRQGLAPPQDALDCYLAGRIETFAGEHGDQAAFARAYEWSFRANLLAPAPRLLYQLDLAHLCHHVGDGRNGHRIAEVLQQRWPDSALAWCWSGFAISDDLPAAIAAYQRAIDLKPDYGLALLNLGSGLEHAGRTDEAIAICRRAVAARRWDPGAEFNLGVALDKKGQREEATAAYRRALVLQPDHPQAHANLAAELYQDGDFAGALAHYDQAVQNKPDYDVAWMMRGGVLAQQSDFAGSIASIRKALEVRPDYLLAHVNLARVLQASGDAAGARQQLEQAQVLFRSKPQPDAHAIATLQKVLREVDAAAAAAGKAR